MCYDQEKGAAERKNNPKQVNSETDSGFSTGLIRRNVLPEHTKSILLRGSSVWDTGSVLYSVPFLSIFQLSPCAISYQFSTTTTIVCVVSVLDRGSGDHTAKAVLARVFIH